MDSPYVDVFVMPIATRRLKAYRKWALLGRKVFLRHGALAYREYVGEDLTPEFPGVKFPAMAKAKRGETVVTAVIGYKSRAHRDRVMKRAIADPAMCSDDLGPMPFDPDRMAYGGFTRLV
jgi:uncharacterized protein YbaA (DUF1428 family)